MSKEDTWAQETARQENGAFVGAGSRIQVSDAEKIDYVWHSNRIDYNTIDPRLLTREEVSQVFLDEEEDAELVSHFDALKLAIHLASRSIVDVDTSVRDLHRCLSRHLLAEEESGKYRKWPVYIGADKCPSHAGIPAYIARLQLMVNSARTEQDAWEVHDEFECIHPFSDCNGRTMCMHLY